MLEDYVELGGIRVMMATTLGRGDVGIKLRCCGRLSSLIRALPGEDYRITDLDDKGIDESVSQDSQDR